MKPAFHLLVDIMKVLFLVQKEQRAILDRLYESIAENCDCDLRWLSSTEQADLKIYFQKHINVKLYDRILIFLRSKKMFKQTEFLKTIPNLVILEHDACRNYFPNKYREKFSKYYRKLPNARIIVSGATLAERLRSEGFDAIFVPKGYDQTILKNLHITRDIELGFLGSIENRVYKKRKKFLKTLSKTEPLIITRTSSGEEYLNMMNRIRFFASADIGFGEYMIKNFEAMACGCVLFAYDPGNFENQSLGFKDMEHLVLYRTMTEFREKLAFLRQHPETADTIANAGQAFVEEKFTFHKLGKNISQSLFP